MIDKKMKHVQDGVALPTGVAAAAAVGQAQANGREKKPPVVDISEYPNLTMALDNWLGVEDHCRAFLQYEIGPREEAAKKLLDLADAPADERRYAERLLVKCREDRAQFEERLDRAVKQVAQIKVRLAPMEMEVKRQRKLRSLAAALR